MADSGQSRGEKPPSARAALGGRGGLLYIALALGMLAAGCLQEPKETGFSPVRPAATAAADAKMAENAVWREKYAANRPVPPREFSVPAKPPRNNAYGEFDDGNFSGLDAQASLPRLPGDPAVMPMAGGPATYPMAASSYPTSVNLPPERRGGGMASSGASSASSASGASAAAGGAIIANGAGAASGAGASGASGGTNAYLADPAAAGRAVRAAENPRGAGIQTEGHFYPIEQLVYGGDYPDIDKPELYRLMPKDVVTVSVKEHPEFSGKLEIQPDGTVQIPNCTDLIHLRGLTVDEAAETLRQELQLFIKGDCIVRVQANRARGGYYFVFGDVRQPGRFPMGLEPIRLSDAVLAANWEANPARSGYDDEEFGPAFPTASPRGKFIAPGSSDLARVMLITPHRSRPARTVHDVRSAMLGVTRNDPLIKPGMVIVVPSLDPQRNLGLGLDFPELAVPPPARNVEGGYPAGNGSGQPAGQYSSQAAGGSFAESQGRGNGNGFSGAGTPARLPEVLPAASPMRNSPTFTTPCIETNMARNFGIQSTTPATPVEEPEIYYEAAADCPETVYGDTGEVCLPNLPKMPGSWGRTTVNVPAAEAFPTTAGYLPGTISSVPLGPGVPVVTASTVVKTSAVPTPAPMGAGAVTVPSVNPQLPPASAVPVSPPASAVVQTQQVYLEGPVYSTPIPGAGETVCESDLPSLRGRRLHKKKAPETYAEECLEPAAKDLRGWKKGF